MLYFKYLFSLRTMEISAWEMLRDVLPANRRILPLDIVKHVEESMLSTKSICAADKKIQIIGC